MTGHREPVECKTMLNRDRCAMTWVCPTALSQAEEHEFAEGISVALGMDKAGRHQGRIPRRWEQRKRKPSLAGRRTVTQSEIVVFFD